MWIEKIVGDLGDKKYREYKERVRQLPDALSGGGWRARALSAEPGSE